MQISTVKVQHFRSHQNLEVGLHPYTTLIGKNDSGKSAFLHALHMLFSEPTLFQASDVCAFSKSDDPDAPQLECSVEVTISGASPHPLMKWEGDLRIRRVFHPPSTACEYFGMVPTSNTVRALMEGRFKKGDPRDAGPDAEKLINELLQELPKGVVSADVSKAIFAKLEEAELVAWKPGWAPLPLPITDLVRVVFLSAEVRVTDEAADRGNRSLVGLIGDLLVRTALRKHEGIVKAREELERQIAAAIAKKDDSSWELEPLNRLTELLKEEMSLFGDAAHIETAVTPPKLPALDFTLDVSLSDDVVTDPRKLGHGLQRAAVFTLIRVLSRLHQENSKVGGSAEFRPLHLFLIEEPELYLHPQLERARQEELILLSEQDDCQVVLCTHSAFFVDLTRYQGILKFDRSERRCTTVRAWNGPDLGPADAEILKTTHFFDPGRSAMLFADLVILVEGQAEKVTVPYLAKNLELPTAITEMVECGGGGSMPICQRVLESFGVRYVAWIDSDDASIRTKVTEVMSEDFGRLVVTNVKWEKMAELPMGDKEKPFRSWKAYVVEMRKPNDAMVRCIRAAYSWENHDESKTRVDRRKEASDEFSILGDLMRRPHG